MFTSCESLKHESAVLCRGSLSLCLSLAHSGQANFSMDMAVFLFGYAMLGFNMFQPFQSISVIYVIMNASATTYMYQCLHGNKHLDILYSMTYRSNIINDVSKNALTFPSKFPMCH